MVLALPCIGWYWFSIDLVVVCFFGLEKVCTIGYPCSFPLLEIWGPCITPLGIFGWERLHRGHSRQSAVCGMGMRFFLKLSVHRRSKYWTRERGTYFLAGPGGGDYWVPFSLSTFWGLGEPCATFLDICRRGTTTQRIERKSAIVCRSALNLLLLRISKCWARRERGAF